MNYEITIPGDPVAQHRPRFSRRSGRCYDAQKDVKDSLTYHIAKQWVLEPLEGPIMCSMTFWMKIPASTSRKKAMAMDGQPCLKHKDCSNLLKMYEDCMIGIVMRDDSQIWRVVATKYWSHDPHTEITIVTIEP